MKKHSVTFDQFDVVVVPFPFTDRESAKRRPAVVVSSRSFNEKSGRAIMAMVTSLNNPSWPNDVEISDLQAAGLPSPSKARMKLFTIDLHLVLRKAGKLGRADRQEFKDSLQDVVG